MNQKQLSVSVMNLISQGNHFIIRVSGSEPGLSYVKDVGMICCIQWIEDKGSNPYDSFLF